VTISGNNASRVFQIDSGVTASLSGLAITGGRASQGGGLYNLGTAMLTNCTVSGNTAGGSGGGVFNGGTATLTDCTVSGNTTPFNFTSKGGGIFNSGLLTLSNSTVAGNYGGATAVASSVVAS
jgi:hypothetical protein